MAGRPEHAPKIMLLLPVMQVTRTIDKEYFPNLRGAHMKFHVRVCPLGKQINYSAVQCNSFLYTPFGGAVAAGRYSKTYYCNLECVCCSLQRQLLMMPAQPAAETAHDGWLL